MLYTCTSTKFWKDLIFAFSVYHWPNTTKLLTLFIVSETIPRSPSKFKRYTVYNIMTILSMYMYVCMYMHVHVYVHEHVPAMLTFAP